MTTMMVSTQLRLTARGAAELERMRRKTREALDRMQGEGEEDGLRAAPERNGRTLSP